MGWIYFNPQKILNGIIYLTTVFMGHLLHGQNNYICLLGNNSKIIMIKHSSSLPHTSHNTKCNRFTVIKRSDNIQTIISPLFLTTRLGKHSEHFWVKCICWNVYMLFRYLKLHTVTCYDWCLCCTLERNHVIIMGYIIQYWVFWVSPTTLHWPRI